MGQLGCLAPRHAASMPDLRCDLTALHAKIEELRLENDL